MKVAFSNVNFESFSGPNQFAYKLATELTQIGFEVCDTSAEGYDACLAFIENFNDIDKKTPLIHRLDGIWFKPDDFKHKNKNILKTYNSAAGIIFQSEFDKKMIEKHFGKRDVPSVVINNGTYAKNISMNDNIKIEWLENIKNDFDKVFVASSQWKNRPHKRLKEAIRLVNEYSAWSNEHCCLLTLGESDFFKPEIEIKHSENFIHIHLGNIMPSQAFVPYCYGDWMIHLAYLDHCPNVVVDALSCQLPVICSSEGGTKEIVKDRGIILQEEKYNFELCDYTKPPKLTFDERLFGKIKKGMCISEDNIDDLSIKSVTDRYVDFINKIITGSNE